MRRAHSRIMMLCSQLYRGASHSARCAPATLHTHAAPPPRANAWKMARPLLQSSRPLSVLDIMGCLAHARAPVMTVRDVATRSGGAYPTTEFNPAYVNRVLVTGVVCGEVMKNKNEHGMIYWVPVEADGVGDGRLRQYLLEHVAKTPEDAKELESDFKNLWIGNPVHGQGQGRFTDRNPPDSQGVARESPKIIEMRPESPDFPMGSQLFYLYNHPSEAQHAASRRKRIDASQVQAMSPEDKWQLVSDRPNLWWDNRSTKTNPRAPDFVFKDKSANVSLWLSSKDTPPWAKDLPGHLPPPSTISQQPSPSPPPAAPPSPPEQQHEGAPLGSIDASQVQAMSPEDKWQLVTDRPDLWWDNRSNKTNPRAPDFRFKDKSANVSLWLSSKDTPAWAKDLPEPLPPPSTISQQPSPSPPPAAPPSPPEQQQQQHKGTLQGSIDASQVQAMSPEDKWQLVVERPDLWWDNRSDKKNPRAPDFVFKDKSAGVSLWLSSKDTPAWAKDLPEPLPPPSTISQQPSPSPPPAASPPPPEQQQQQQQQQKGAPQGSIDASQVKSMSIGDKWQLVVERPNLWWDNRSNKTNPRAPDFVFKDKSANVSLWLSSKDTPAWAKDLPEPLPPPSTISQQPSPSPPAASPPPPEQQRGGSPQGSIDASQMQAMSIEDKWQLVVERPDLWWDNRSHKTNPRAPDFKSKDKNANVSLWLSSKDTPAWAKEHFSE